MSVALAKLTIPATWIVAILLGGFGALQWMDGRYAQAEDVKHDIGVLRTEVKQNADETREQLRLLRVQQLEDKIFELELKANKTQADLALIQRYQAQLLELKR